MYYYICFGAPKFQQFYPTSSIVDALSGIEGLQQATPLSFSSAEGYPWAHLVLAVGDSQGNYCVKDSDNFPEINLIEIIRSNETITDFHREIIDKIQQLTDWCYEDSTDDQEY
jgi:hypothetical protein